MDYPIRLHNLLDAKQLWKRITRAKSWHKVDSNIIFLRELRQILHRSIRTKANLGLRIYDPWQRHCGLKHTPHPHALRGMYCLCPCHLSTTDTNIQVAFEYTQVVSAEREIHFAVVCFGVKCVGNLGTWKSQRDSSTNLAFSISGAVIQCWIILSRSAIGLFQASWAMVEQKGRSWPSKMGESLKQTPKKFEVVLSLWDFGESVWIQSCVSILWSVRANGMMEMMQLVWNWHFIKLNNTPALVKTSELLEHDLHAPLRYTKVLQGGLIESGQTVT